MAKKKSSTEVRVIEKTLVYQGFASFPFGITEIADDKNANHLMKLMLNDILDETKNFRSITQWCLAVGLHPQDLDIYREKHALFQKAYNVCKAKIGERRELEILNGAPTVMTNVLPQFHADWRRERDERVALKANAEGKGQVNLTVNVPKLPEEKK